MSDAPFWTTIAIAALLGYVIGSLPAAYAVSRTRGINIFKVGTGQAGTTNVWREVSPRLGAIVFFVDVGKGIIAVLLGGWLGLNGDWLLVPAVTVVMGHWNSMFTGFKGGDGVAAGAGACLGLAQFAAVIPSLVVLFVSLRWRSRFTHPTLWAGIAGWATLMVVAPIHYEVGTGRLIGVTGILLAMLLHAVVYRRRFKSRERKRLAIAAAEALAVASQEQHTESQA